MNLLRPLVAVALAAGALVAPVSASAAVIIAQSNFATGADGWRQGDFTSGRGSTLHDLAWDAAGFVTANDDFGQFTGFVASAAFRGDRSLAYGGELSFDIATAFAAYPGDHAYVTLRNGSTSLYGLFRTTGPTSSFSRFSVAISEGSFWVGNPEDNPTAYRASEGIIRGVLANLQDITIRADIASGDDLASLDNVVLTAGDGSTGPVIVLPGNSSQPPTTVVPEPATWAMMILGFGLAGASFRQRRAIVASQA